MTHPIPSVVNDPDGYFAWLERFNAPTRVKANGDGNLGPKLPPPPRAISTYTVIVCDECGVRRAMRGLICEVCRRKGAA